MKKVILTVSGGCVDIEKNEYNIPITIVDYDNEDILEEKYPDNFLVVQVIGGVAVVHQQPEDVQVNIVDYDNIDI